MMYKSRKEKGASRPMVFEDFFDSMLGDRRGNGRDESPDVVRISRREYEALKAKVEQYASKPNPSTADVRRRLWHQAVVDRYEKQDEEPFYEITSPVFERVVIHLDERYHAGKTFVIEARGASPENVYIQSANLNGEPLDRPWFYHRDLARGGKLELVLGSTPNEHWNSRPEDAPPSINTDKGSRRQQR